MKKKKLLVLLLVIVFISSSFEMPITVSAVSAELLDNNEIQPRYTNLQLLDVFFEVDKSTGDAVAGVITSFYSNTDHIVIKVEFERKDPDGWFNLATAWAAKKKSPADLETSINVKPGYYYRAVVTIELYDKDGELAEKVTLPSKADYY